MLYFFCVINVFSWCAPSVEISIYTAAKVNMKMHSRRNCLGCEVERDRRGARFYRSVIGLVQNRLSPGGRIVPLSKVAVSRMRDTSRSAGVLCAGLA